MSKARMQTAAYSALALALALWLAGDALWILSPGARGPFPGHADCDRPTFSAKAALGMRPSFCKVSKMAISILSSGIYRISFETYVIWRNK